MLGLFKKFKREQTPKHIPLDYLYMRKYRRDMMLVRMKNFKDMPSIILEEQERLVAKVDAEIGERHSKLKAIIMAERVALDKGAHE